MNKVKRKRNYFIKFDKTVKFIQIAISVQERIQRLFLVVKGRGEQEEGKGLTEYIISLIN